MDRLFNTTFICTVTNAVGTGHAEQVVLVRGKRVLGMVCTTGSAPQVFLPSGFWGCTGGGCAADLGRIQTRLNDGRGPVWLAPRWDLIGVTG